MTQSAPTTSCGACGRDAAGSPLCTSCQRGFARAYHPETKTMAKPRSKKTQTVDLTPLVPGAEALTLNNAPITHFIAKEEDFKPLDDGADVAMGARVEEDMDMDLDALMAQPAAAAEPEAAAAAPTSGRYAFLKRVNAAKALKSAIKLLSSHDYSAFDLMTVGGAVQILQRADAAMDKLGGASKRAKVAPGALVRIKPKFTNRYTAIPHTDLAVQTSPDSANGTVHVTHSNNNYFLPKSHLEIQP